MISKMISCTTCAQYTDKNFNLQAKTQITRKKVEILSILEYFYF